jgi:hypothetical protein
MLYKRAIATRTGCLKTHFYFFSRTHKKYGYKKAAEKTSAA